MSSRDGSVQASRELSEIISEAYGSMGQFSAEQIQSKLATIRKAVFEQSPCIDTPMFVIEGQRFLGREHLAWMESLLAD